MDALVQGVVERAPLPETPDHDGAFPRLGQTQMASLSRRGERRRVEAGDVLFREGDRRHDFFVILDGQVAVVVGSGEDAKVFAVHEAGRFLGELSLLTGQAAFFTAVATVPGEVLQVPVEELRKLVSRDAGIGDLVVRAYLMRREMLIGVGAGLQIVGSRYSRDARALREFAARNRLPHRWIDLEQDADAERMLQSVGVAPHETPVVAFKGEVLRNPTVGELATVLGMRQTAPSAEDACDLVVVGAGPAGLAAAVYGASEGLSTLALDAVATGGQAGTSSRIENYLGFPSGISGSELAERATIQAEKFGAHIDVSADVAALERRDGHYALHLADGAELACRTIVIATGARYRRLDVARLDEFEGTSVLYAATFVEALMCHGDPVAVVGGGNSAGQAALFMAEHADPVHLIVRSGDLGKDMSRYLVDEIARHPSVDVHLHTEIRELEGDAALRGLVVEDNRTHERRRLDARILFVFIGAAPRTDWLGGQVDVDDRGFVLTGRDDALPLETSLPGVFAAGDVRSGSIKRMASAVGEGAMAVRLVHDHLQSVGALTPAQTYVAST